MSVIGLEKLPAEAAGLRLGKFSGEDLRLCEAVRFTKGAAAVNTILRRAAISGHVEVAPADDLPDHFADVLDGDASIIGHVALDPDSFRSLKNHWMRCKYEPVA